MGAVTIWAWDETNKVYRKVLVDDEGKLIISDADPFTVQQTTPMNLRHVPHGYYAVGGTYLPLAVDSAGKLLLSIPSLQHLDDIDDVYVPSPTDEYFLYWDAATSLWKCKAVPAGAWADITGKPASPSLEELATEHSASGLHAPSISRAKAYGSTEQPIPAANIVLPVLDTEAFDVGNEFDSSLLTGTATATTAGHLIDITKNQFTAADVGKKVWNTTDNTYTLVTSFVSTSNLTLQDDIMANGEGYKLYFSKFTATATGVYLIFVKLYVSSATLGDYINMYIQKNGVAIATTGQYTAGATHMCWISTFASLVATDYIQFAIRNLNHTCIIAAALDYTYMEIIRLV